LSLRAVGIQHAKARRALVKLKLDVADSANASMVLLGELLEVLLDPEIPDPQVRQAVWQRATPQELQLALDLAAEIKRPLGDNHVEQLGDGCNAARQFAPRVLATLRLRANPDGEALLAAVEVSRTSTAAGRGASPMTRQSDSSRAAGGPTSILQRAGSTAITGSCAYCRSCVARCGPARYGCRAAAATPTPNAS